ncbi:MAG: glycosyl transferase [Bacteroidales bacterium]|nr:glycosyl transferase [Bacteroidales bacterium]
MIPKTIHLCWLSGDPYPKKIQYCIDSWKKYLPDYEIILWDTKRFDVNSTPWTKQAFEAKKYAFVADYIRLYAVYNFGGIYLDSDVEVIKSFDDVLHLPYFAGIEAGPDGVELAAFGAEKGTPWVKYALDYYEGRNFILDNGEMSMTPMPPLMGERLREKYEWTLIGSPAEFDADPAKFCLFPQDWFGARPLEEKGGMRYFVTGNTHSIHHYANSWTEDEYPGGLLHKLYFKITGKDWKYADNRFRLYGDKKNRKKYKI